jgi:H+-transporting ATPase
MDLKIRTTHEYKKVSLEETFKLLEAHASGLNGSEAQRRISIFGYNEITEKKKNPFFEFLLRYWGPMPWLLELAIALSFVLGHDLEGGIIFILLTLNALIGYLHSHSSQKEVELLKKKLAIKAKVLRNGIWLERDAKELVPGDVIVIKLGDIVPADTKVIEGELLVDDSALTGESLPKEARQSDIIYSSSVVKRGTATCIVVNTAANTYFGKTAELVKIAKPKSHQEEVMMSVVEYMMYLGIIASVMVAVSALFMHVSVLLILTFILIFLMGAVPVALPAVLTIIQSVGAMELSKKGVLVTRLDSIEDAASIDVLCFDKTGTITQNRLAVIDCLPFFGYKEEDVITIANLASQSKGMDAIDLAVIESAKNRGITFDRYKQNSFIPFNPSLKRTEAVIEIDGKIFKAVKGAAQVVIGMCGGMDKEDIGEINKAMAEFSKKGYRTIAVARSKADSGNLEFAGLLSLADPLRPDSRGMIEEVRRLGIKPIMLTGDNIAIAQEIAHQVGIGSKIIRMGDLEGLGEDKQVQLVEESDGFAEIYPEDKYKIVKLLQSRSRMVGMTGDGVNDAPALKQAEMGIAVSAASDVAKASASVVLTEPGISVIIDAVEISREAYQRMLTWVINKVTKVIEFVGLLTLGFFWLHDIVISLLGMSLLVVANDFVTMSLATDNVKYTSNPNKWNVLNITLSSLIPAMLLVAEGLIVILIGTRYFRLEWAELRTLVMLNLVFNSQFRVLIVRERRHFWSSFPGRNLLALSFATIIGFALIGFYGIFVPSVSIHQILTVLAFSTIFAFGIDFPKYHLFKKFGL